MAGDRARMADLEDGELESDHESDMRDAAEERVQVKPAHSVQHTLVLFLSTDWLYVEISVRISDVSVAV